ncbi:MAG: MGMT family protein [Chthonomonadales bacterium]|nr:MGMT family protein [Chthonomonadales bacterium]
MEELAPHSPAAQAVYAYVRTVPPGRVVTYGQVAEMVETVALTPRQVGHIMNNAPEDVPWQRVVGAGGNLPIGKRGTPLMMRQRQLLEQEGVPFRADGRIDMGACQLRADDPLGGIFGAAEE